MFHNSSEECSQTSDSHCCLLSCPVLVLVETLGTELQTGKQKRRELLI